MRHTAQLRSLPSPSPSPARLRSRSRRAASVLIACAAFAVFALPALPVLVPQAHAATPTAGSVKVWRCGADGRSFSDRPCNDGHTAELRFDAPGADRQAQAQAVAQREALSAAELQRERLRRDAQARRDGPGLGTLGPVAAVAEFKPRVRTVSEASQGPHRQQPQGPARVRSRAPEAGPDKGAGTSPEVRHASRRAPD